MKIYYIPFKVETYVPVTTNDIESRAIYIFEVPNDSELAIKLTKMLEQDNHGAFDNKKVRLKVRSDDKIYYIDSEGHVMVSMKISQCNKEDIEKVIKEMISKYKIKKTRQ